MDHNYSQSHGQSEGSPTSILNDEAALTELAKEKLFQQRRRGSLTPGVFLQSMMRAAQSGATSFLSIAVLCGIQTNGTLAKQSLWERVNPRAFAFLSAVLCRLMSSRYQARQFLTRSIKRILVADSTVMRLHPSLEPFFPGSRNQHAKTSQSSARLHAFLGEKEAIPVLLEAVLLPGAVAAERRRKARANRDKRVNYNDDYYELLDWSIVITNIGEDELGGIDVYGLYALRWRMENIFKAWKSNLPTNGLAGHKTNVWHVKCLVVSQMIVMVRLSHLRIFAIAGKDGPGPEMEPATGRAVPPGMSMFKMLKIMMLCSWVAQPTPETTLAKQLIYHTPYDKRKRMSLPALAINFLA